jgi:hypothetical protein
MHRAPAGTIAANLSPQQADDDRPAERGKGGGVPGRGQIPAVTMEAGNALVQGLVNFRLRVPTLDVVNHRLTSP